MSNTAATSQAGLRSPRGLTYDTVHQRLFVADAGNNRVLVFSGTSYSNNRPAQNVLGQATFETSAAGVTSAGMSNPCGVAYDSVHDRLFIADTNNDRVLAYDVSSIADGMDAAVVLTGFSHPIGLAYDAEQSRLFVTDSYNDRIKIMDASTNDMTVIVTLSTGMETTRSGMWFPTSVSYDEVRRLLYVADNANKRILVFDGSALSNGMNATYVLGKATYDANTSATTQAGIGGPWSVQADANHDRLFVTDSENNRVLAYDVSSITDGMDAINVLGQTHFDTGTSALSQMGINTSRGLAFDDTTGTLFVADTNNNRVLVFDVADTAPTVSDAGGGAGRRNVLLQELGLIPSFFDAFVPASSENSPPVTTDAPVAVPPASTPSFILEPTEPPADAIIPDSSNGGGVQSFDIPDSTSPSARSAASLQTLQSKTTDASMSNPAARLTIGNLSAILSQIAGAGSVPTESRPRSTRLASRAMAAAFVVQALNLQSSSEHMAASDDSLRAGYLAARDLKIIRGFDTHNLAPDQPVTVAELAVMIERARMLASQTAVHAAPSPRPSAPVLSPRRRLVW